MVFTVYTIQIFQLMMTYLHGSGSLASVFEQHFTLEWIMAICLAPLVFFAGFVYEVWPRWIIYIMAAILSVVLAALMHPLENSGWFAVVFFSRFAFATLFINP